MDEIYRLLHMLPREDEVVELRKYVGENIERFSADLEKFTKGYNQSQEIIRRYDEVISDKASKHTVYSLEHSQKESLNEHFKKAMDLIQENFKKF